MWRTFLGCAIIAAAAVSVCASAVDYGLFADDFQWPVGAQQFDAARLLSLSDRTHFYRPVVELYFPAAVAACGRSASCFHWLSTVAHAATSLLVALMVGAISRRWACGALAGVLFAVEPAPVEAVIWVSAISELLATGLFVVTVWLFWRAMTSGRLMPYIGACLSFAACLLTHESGITLVAVLALVLFVLPANDSAREATTRTAPSKRLLMLVPFAALSAAYLLVAYVINSRNYVVTQGRYAVGIHVLSNMLDALVTLAVANREPLALLIVIGLTLWASLGAPPRVRFYTLWTLVTLLPFAGFRDGLSSRYLYLPAVGFAALLADALWLVRPRLERWTRAGVVVWWVLTIALTVRFATFAAKNVEAWEHVSTPFREYTATVRALYPSPGIGAALEVPVPPEEVAPHYVPSLLQWEYADVTLRPAIRQPRAPGS